MKIKDLKPGFAVYSVTYSDFIRYEYLCPMPVKNKVNEGFYFIFINNVTEAPVRLYKDSVQRLLDEGIFTLEDCLNKQIELSEQRVEFLKEKRDRNE